MIKSMTGFGRGKASFAGGNVLIEVKTFNHKYLELSLKLPDSFQEAEEQVKKVIKKYISRGKLYLWMHYEQLSNPEQDIVIDHKKLSRYHELLKQIKKKLKLKDEISLQQLMSYPDIIVNRPPQQDKKLLQKAANSALVKAVDSLLKMRQREGRALAVDLSSRARQVEASLKKITVYLPQEINHFRNKLKEKTGKALDKNMNGMKKERIEAEVALFAKNCDIAEELTRLKAHITNFKATIKTSSEAGKVLDFIAQEIQREVNTIGAKSSDYRIAKEVIKIKSEIEKIREQVQNVE